MGEGELGEGPVGGFGALFERAGTEFAVPPPLLAAIAHAETRGQMVRGESELDELPAAWGLMALRGERLELGAKLLGVPVAQVREDPLANVRAAAALLRDQADVLRIRGDSIEDWAPVVGWYSGLEQEEARYSYVNGTVYRRLGRTIGTAAKPSVVLAGPDYERAVWRASPNYNERPAGDIGRVGMLIIHTCEGSYTTCWSHLTKGSSRVSAHYVVSEDGSEISQLVRESMRAWHIKARYRCSLNSEVDCWRNDAQSNHFTVGIEHGGYASQTSFPESQLEASAALACDITKDHHIPRDRYHILGHGKLQPEDRTDPGKNWPWTDYLERVNALCSGPTMVIDSDNALNDMAKGYSKASSSWRPSTSVAGFYGSGYLWASMDEVADGASFYFHLDQAQTRSIDVWWTAAADRTDSAQFVALDAQENKLGSMKVNQREGGGRWTSIGSFDFSAGWNRIVLSRWGVSGSGVAIADAVRVR